MSKLYIFSVMLAFPLFMANKCDDKQGQSTNKKMSAMQSVIVDNTFNFSTNFDKYSITDATIKDSILTLTFEAAVCKDENIDLVFNGNYLKSYPPKAQLGVRFDANSKCIKKIILTKSYNLGTIKYPNAKSLVVLLPNKKSIMYSY